MSRCSSSERRTEGFDRRAATGAMTPALARATAADAEAVHALLAAAGRHLATQGYHNWQPPYPLERVRADIATREVYLARDGAVPVASFMLGREPMRPYDHAFWEEGPALYLNRLAVAPDAQGRGVGDWCLRVVAARARELGVRAVRCDVLSANTRLRRLYERHGYVARGEREHSGWRFTCYEMVLEGA